MYKEDIIRHELHKKEFNSILCDFHWNFNDYGSLQLEKSNWKI